MTQPPQASTAAVSTIVQPISVPASDSPVAIPSRDTTQDALEAENLIETYQIIGEWVRFADAKAAAVLAVNGALCGALIPLLNEYMKNDQPHPTAWWATLVSIAFLLWLAAMVCSCVFSFRCILPFRRRGLHPAIGHANHFHPAAIAQAYSIDEPDRFAKEMDCLGMSGLKREISICMMIDAHISSQKYINVTRAIRMLALSSILGLLYLLAVQF